MAKPFLTYQQQIQKLINDKQLIIHDTFWAEQKLQDLGYFALIGGYLYRNVCAHNERLFSHKIYSEIPDTILHYKLKIPQIGTQYISGKRDLFGVVIAFRYLLSKSDFKVLKKELVKLIEKYMKSSKRVSEEQLLELMGFPMNWKRISRYKI